MEVGKVTVSRKKGKVENDDWMIGLNQPRPFTCIGWEDLPCKQRFTTQNQVKLLILPQIGEAQLDHLAPMCWTGYNAPRSDRPRDPADRPA
jgi:hypothetical protein